MSVSCFSGSRRGRASPRLRRKFKYISASDSGRLGRAPLAAGAGVCASAETDNTAAATMQARSPRPATFFMTLIHPFTVEGQVSSGGLMKPRHAVKNTLKISAPQDAGELWTIKMKRVAAFLARINDHRSLPVL